MNVRPPALTALIASAALLVPGSLALARTAATSSSPRVSIAARTERGSFHGSLTLQRFAAARQGLVAIGTLTGVLSDSRYPAAQAIRYAGFRIGARVAGTGRGSCSVLTLALGPLEARLFGLRATVAAQRVALGPATAPGRQIACAIQKQARAKASPAVLARLLGSLLAGRVMSAAAR